MSDLLAKQAQADKSVVLQHISALPSLVVNSRRDALPEDYVRVTLVDTETTGVSDTDRVIELAMQSVYLDRKQGYGIVQVEHAWIQMQDPGRPIPPEASAVNGIFDADVAGRFIDWVHVKETLDGSDVVMAFNAGFDRRMLERELEEVPDPDKPDGFLELDTSPDSGPVWACPLAQLKWQGVPARSQEVLCAFVAGFWYDGHRADADILALLYLLSRTGRFEELLTRAYAPDVVVRIAGAFAAKDAIKARGYQFDGTNKVWWKTLSSVPAELEVELEWANRECFPSMGRDLMLTRSVRLDPIRPQIRFSRYS